jgi:hypothetical protein
MPERAITDINISCVTRSYLVGGNVSGLDGSLVLRNNGGESLSIASDGAFQFATPTLDGGAYQVTIASSPPQQQCSLTSASGAIASEDVSSIQVTCTAAAFAIGGTVAGVIGPGLILRNNGESVSVAADQSFSFPTTLRFGDTYNVTVQAAPAGQTCTVTNGTGTIGGPLSAVRVVCSFPLTLGTAMRRLVFSWPTVAGATSYELWGSEDGSALSRVSTFSSMQTSTSIDVAVHRFPWTTARYQLRACASTCTDSNEVVTANRSAEAIGYFKASNSGVFDDFGNAVALSADGMTMAVGAVYERSAATGIDGDQSDDSGYQTGAVYVFSRSGDTWVQQAYIKASNAEDGDYFGATLDLSDDGNTLIVAALNEDSASAGVGGNPADNSALQSGAVYVFARTGSAWSEQAYLKASNTVSGLRFGSAVALSGDGGTLAVAAPAEASNAAGIDGDQSNGSIPGAGAVYVFARAGASWSQQAYVKASNTGLDSFGAALGLSSNGNTLVVGAPTESSLATGVDGNQNDDSGTQVGAVYVFARSGSSWAQQNYLKPSYISADDAHQLFFGASLGVSADGNTLAIGAPNENGAAALVDGDPANMGRFNSGAVYVFSRLSGHWAQRSYLKASNPGTSDYFGHELALSADGQSLVVASTYEDSPARGIGGEQTDTSSETGAAYFYTDSGSGWQFESYIKASNTGAYFNFASSVALSADGTVLAVGSSGEQSNATGIGGDQSDRSQPSGAVYLY